MTTPLEHQRYINKFIWVPYYKRIGRFGSPLSSKVDDRTPIFWTAVSGNSLYFVNNSTEILDCVKVKTGGFQTCDEDIVMINTDEYSYKYHSVVPLESVKIDEYDVYLDSDFIIQRRIIVKSTIYGDLELLTKPEKGGISSCVLMW